MTKSDLIKLTADALKEDEKIAQQYVQAIIDIMCRELANRKTFYIRGFGTLGPKYRAPKVARNIKKGTTVNVPGRFQIAFKAAPQLNAAANKAAPQLNAAANKGLTPEF